MRRLPSDLFFITFCILVRLLVAYFPSHNRLARQYYRHGSNVQYLQRPIRLPQQPWGGENEGYSSLARHMTPLLSSSVSTTRHYMLGGSKYLSAAQVYDHERDHRARTALSIVFRSRRSHSSTEPSSSLQQPTNSSDPTAVETTSSSAATEESTVMVSLPGQKLRLLKDLMWVRESLEDLTAAEFACSVEAAAATSSDQEVSRKRKRAVDYEKLLSRLNRRLQDLGCEAQGDGTVLCVLQPGVGLGTLVYTHDQRQQLMERILVTRQLLLDLMKGNGIYHDDELSFPISLSGIGADRLKEEDSLSSGPKLYVRDDGTVDWDGALQDREALRKFGTAVWARINGRDPDSLETDDKAFGGNGHKTKEVMVQVEETPRIRESRLKLDAANFELQQMEKAHIALLNSAISAGQAVANVNLASLNPSQRAKIRKSAEELEKKKEKVSFQTLIYELERIYTYLTGELGNPSSTGYVPLQDRLNVAEFGLLESQIDMLSRMIDEDDSLDSDVLAVVTEQLVDMKRRLGIDYLITGLSFDREAIWRWSSDLVEKTKKGIAFYVKGIRLFWNDIVFCLSLINRAAQGYTLKPREVRTLRRTFKDIITFIPVIIILIIPLSPVGHVLVFGAIQRFYPDFFPSCFTEQRQNLLQLYEAAEYSEVTIDENWKEKTARLIEAFVYFLANVSRAIYAKVLKLLSTPSITGNDEDVK